MTNVQRVYAKAPLRADLSSGRSISRGRNGAPLPSARCRSDDEFVVQTGIGALARELATTEDPDILGVGGDHLVVVDMPLAASEAHVAIDPRQVP